ncbi:hypothetical protein D5086_021341 [Populus alba]|uniref:Uncharacterized protein n=1 Tax=Populus alba TaxID=43335 RepID=A0ACC4BBW4_POPAL
MDLSSLTSSSSFNLLSELPSPSHANLPESEKQLRKPGNKAIDKKLVVAIKLLNYVENEFFRSSRVFSALSS